MLFWGADLQSWGIEHQNLCDRRHANRKRSDRQENDLANLNHSSERTKRTVSALSVSGPSHGSLTLNLDGTYTYTPNLSYVGSDSFTYKFNDGLIDSDPAIVSIDVGNNAPYFDVSTQTFELNEGELSDGDVLGTIVATDTDGDPLTYSSPNNLTDLGLTLIPIVLGDGRNAVKVIVSDKVKLWKKSS